MIKEGNKRISVFARAREIAFGLFDDKNTQLKVSSFLTKVIIFERKNNLGRVNAKFIMENLGNTYLSILDKLQEKAIIERGAQYQIGMASKRLKIIDKMLVMDNQKVRIAAPLKIVYKHKQKYQHTDKLAELLNEKNLKRMKLKTDEDTNAFLGRAYKLNPSFKAKMVENLREMKGKNPVTRIGAYSRLYSPVTDMDRFMKGLFEVDGEELVEIKMHLSCATFYLGYKMMLSEKRQFLRGRRKLDGNNKKARVGVFLNHCVSGKFQKLLMNEVNRNIKDRKFRKSEEQIKRYFTGYLFANRQQRQRTANPGIEAIEKFMKRKYKSVHEFVREIPNQRLLLILSSMEARYMVSLFAQKVRTYDSNMFYLNVKDGVLVKKSDEKKVLSILNELHGEYKPKYRKSSFNSDMRRVVGELENGIFSESKYNKPERIKKNQKGKILSVNIHSETELRSYGIIKGEARKLTKWKKGKILEVIEKVCRINDNDDSFLKHNKRRLMTLLQSIKTDLMTGMISIRICKV